MKKTRPKLVLKRETIRALDLTRVRGGYACPETMGACDSLDYTCYNTCTA